MKEKDVSVKSRKTTSLIPSTHLENLNVSGKIGAETMIFPYILIFLNEVWLPGRSGKENKAFTPFQLFLK